MVVKEVSTTDSALSAGLTIVGTLETTPIGGKVSGTKQRVLKWYTMCASIVANQYT